MTTNGTLKSLKNQRLKRAKIAPIGSFVFIEIDEDEVEQSSKSKVWLPDSARGQQVRYSNDSAQAAQDFGLDITAVVIRCGPDTVNVKEGDRFVLPFPPIPCDVVDHDGKNKLGLLDSRDIFCTVED